jgi:hypothetical protein
MLRHLAKLDQIGPVWHVEKQGLSNILGFTEIHILSVLIKNSKAASSQHEVQNILEDMAPHNSRAIDHFFKFEDDLLHFKSWDQQQQQQTTLVDDGSEIWAEHAQ